ncbi:tRNA preQ1(34) S-adenosylmethionine ribosyltransferase-isomerase QueA [uncultured Ruminococcus sp.]|uniref:tRNA preQ1(34) S-adenosylmethionine ribosyltransferase-isomerase QueA n=1 Tax=uncultured Ruminococcus sp. TaxID=165186 RepID=UPI00292E964A|nr:tRNA preQ1(34) S-adenosylmethionine ribosyltransferase-isomerase QueA [uncultured Ruminococcus sp.]
MKTSDFYYDLPQEQIAQTPIEPRDHSRLMVLHRDNDEIEHCHFYDILDYLDEGDCLIVNDSRVIPARIYGVKEDTGAKIEFLLLKQLSGNRWETLVKPGKKAKIGAKFIFGDGLLRAEVVDIVEDGNRIVELQSEENIYTTLDKIGQMPLPPYITAKLEDQERYQTVYSHELGSAAAPTAGLHFTNELLDKIRAKGVNIGYVTLHVGLGTFRPVKVDDVTKHKMHSEHYEIPAETAELIKQTKANGKRVIAVGTTSCRTLESVAASGEIRACDGFTDIFIYPGFTFKVLDGLITNFHLPESTLIMLVSAFYGYDKTMKAYEVAVKEKYRFFSFGDAMAIL